MHSGLLAQARLAAEAEEEGAAQPGDGAAPFVAQVSVAVREEDTSFVYSVLTLGCTTLFRVSPDVLAVVRLPGDGEGRADDRWPGWPEGMELLPWYAAVDAGIVGPGQGPHTVPADHPTTNALGAARAEARAPTVRAGADEAAAAYVAAAVRRATQAQPMKAALFARAAEDFGWGDGDHGRRWLRGVFGAGPELGAEHVRILAAFANPFVDIEDVDGMWVGAAAAAWGDAPPAAKRILAALDHAAAHRLGVRVID